MSPIRRIYKVNLLRYLRPEFLRLGQQLLRALKQKVVMQERHVIVHSVLLKNVFQMERFYIV